MKVFLKLLVNNNKVCIKSCCYLHKVLWYNTMVFCEVPGKYRGIFVFHEQESLCSKGSKNLNVVTKLILSFWWLYYYSKMCKTLSFDIWYVSSGSVKCSDTSIWCIKCIDGKHSLLCRNERLKLPLVFLSVKLKSVHDFILLFRRYKVLYNQISNETQTH